MITKDSGINIILFSQKIVDKDILKKITPEFITNIYNLYSNNKYTENIDKLVQSENVLLKHMIETALFAEIDEQLKSIKDINNYALQITFEKDHPIPLVNLVKNKEDNLLDVYFRKICWDEVNEFRKFVIPYLESYLKKFHNKIFKEEQEINKLATSLAYVINELLQNANQHSFGHYDYELILKFINNQFNVTVTNYARSEKAEKLISIINDIKTTSNIDELLFNYMLDDNKHLGIISSIANFNIKDYTVDYINNEIVQVNFKYNLDI